MPVATPTEIANLIVSLSASTPLGRLALSEATAAFATMASAGYVLYEPGSTGQTFCAGYNDFDALTMRLCSTTALGRLSNVEVHAIFANLGGFLVARPAITAQTGPSSVTETTTTLAANVPALIAPAAPGITKFIIVNNGTGSLVWKTNSAPTSATDGTPLDPASSAGGQGGSILLLGDAAISDPIYAWSTAGTTVNVKQGL